MKFCRHPFEYFRVKNTDGDIQACAWTNDKAIIGNLLRQDLPEIWNSEAASRFRKSVTDGSFTYCNKDACPYLQRNELSEAKDKAVITPTEIPAFIQIACDETCNLCCPSCRREVFIPTKQQKANMEILHQKLLPYYKYAKHINFGGLGEVFVSPFYMKILENFNHENPDTIISFETNGILFDKDHWNKISHLGNYDLRVNVSIDSLYKPTYDYLRRGVDKCSGNFEKVKGNLKFMSDLRKNGEIKLLSICMVVQDNNFLEIPDYIKYGIYDIGVDRVVLRPIWQRGSFTEAEMFVKNVRNPAHPYHVEFLRVLENPLVKHPQVMMWSGDRMINRKDIMVVGARVDLLKQLFNLGIRSRSLSKYLKERSITKICIYGADIVGQVIADGLSNDGIIIGFMIDRSVRSYKDYKLLRLEDVKGFTDVDAVLITSVLSFDSIKDDVMCKHSIDEQKLLNLESIIKELADTTI